ncbi:TIGR03620 family F420-dependent LLM class oxidoreductase [Streptoalloteichus hindustanus]|uniref:Probable F420-dependent oxidoreductase, MSMEG_4141 family n=1 Tax=Streptoalloteichus hindustanus TaxID=2017 RepID=A0A1M5DLN7_STRHI|nr:TIGR03620 family F420-dependent LLM class oxidoreductase [Streptoalloteichus hindustanus]SHF67815.1 probable F420-dependent oxidoreductase, MSMEG_4141 family [Streptoalloteichus hindustanus]
MGEVTGRDLGRFGVWTFDFEDQPASLVRDSAQELEELGWPAIWVPELLGREAMTHAGFLLSCTERLSVVNGIAQIWAREPRWTQGAALLLADAYPDRHLLGLGVGGGRPGTRPLRAMSEYLDAMDATTSPNPAPRSPVRRLLAAYGPKMLELARERAVGAHTYHVTVGHTARAREVLGAAPFLGVEQAVLFETDPHRAREIAREHLHLHLTTEFNVAKFLRLGYTEADIDGGRGSDRLVDDLVVWGELDTIVGRLRQHLAAGADHVGVQVIGIEPGASAMPRWRELAEALLPRPTA